MLLPAPTYLKRSERDGSGRPAECHQQCSGRRRGRCPADIFRLPNARRSRSYEHKAALYRRWRVRSDVRRQRLAGAAAQRRHSQRRFGVSRVDRAMARRAISPTTKADKACAERDLAGLCPGPAGWAGRRSEWRFCSWPVRILERATTRTAAVPPMGACLESRADRSTPAGRLPG